MTGPEHYRKAEIQLEFAATASETETAQWHQHQAQVHATLALVAATLTGSSSPRLSTQWADIEGSED